MGQKKKKKKSNNKRQLSRSSKINMQRGLLFKRVHPKNKICMQSYFLLSLFILEIKRKKKEKKKKRKNKINMQL